MENGMINFIFLKKKQTWKDASGRGFVSGGWQKIAGGFSFYFSLDDELDCFLQFNIKYK